MLMIPPKQTRKIWLPLNRKSQVLVTIAVLAVAAFQVHSWYARSIPSPSAQPVPGQQSPEHQNQ